MQRWTLAIAVIVGCMAGVARADTPTDEMVERYLAGLGVSSVLAERLEHELAGATGSTREAIAERLARVYADLVARGDADERAAQWEQRARTLLESVPEAGTLELRLSLARAAYVRAEATVERGIIRMAPQAEVVDAVGRLDALVGELDRIADEANRKVMALERREESGVDRDATLLGAALAEGRRFRSIAHYLAGNAAVLVALNRHAPEKADIALDHFGWILGAKPGAKPDLDRLPEQNLAYSHVAKSALATALAHAIRGRPDEAMAWIAMVRSAERIPPDLPDLITTREIQCLAEGGQWSQLAKRVAEMRSGIGSAADEEPPRLTVTHARLLAVLALGAPESAPRKPVEEVRDAAVADLVARGELGHVLDLVTAFGTKGFDDSSFIGLEVRGLKSYDDARNAHGATEDERSDPPKDAKTREMYTQAADFFESALRAKGSDQFPDAMAQTMLLVGVCRINAQTTGADDAEAWLTKAADALKDPVRAGAALRLAIHAVDGKIDAAGTSASSDLVKRRDKLIDAFLERFPNDPGAPALIVRRATSPGFDRVRGLTMLLSVPASSPWYGAARHHAAALAFDLYRSAPASERDWTARRFLDLEEPLVAADRRVASEGNRDAAERSVARARRMIEAALGLNVPDLAMADRALEIIDSLSSLGLIDTTPIRGELAYRRAQMALARGDDAAADALLKEAAAADPALARAGDRLRFDAAVRMWRAVRRDAPESTAAIDGAVRVADVGEALLASNDPALSGGTGAVIRSICAEAMLDVFRARGDRARAERAVVLLREALAQQPNARAELIRLATVTEELGQIDESLAAWRTVVSGMTVGSDAWFDARVHQLRVLARVDRDRALAALDQHVTLYPQYGPDPWGPELRELHRSIGGPR